MYNSCTAPLVYHHKDSKEIATDNHTTISARRAVGQDAERTSESSGNEVVVTVMITDAVVSVVALVIVVADALVSVVPVAMVVTGAPDALVAVVVMVAVVTGAPVAVDVVVMVVTDVPVAVLMVVVVVADEPVVVAVNCGLHKHILYTLAPHCVLQENEDKGMYPHLPLPARNGAHVLKLLS